MFTGIIQGTGTILDISKDTKKRSAAKMIVDLKEHATDLQEGQSVALNGVCLTATAITGSTCTFDMIEETMKKTSLGTLKPQGIINIERSLRIGDRLEGHFVLGHIDGTAKIKKIQKKSKEITVYLKVPKRLVQHIVKKGSIAIDGISLTVTNIKKCIVTVSLIPHTVQITNFENIKKGDTVNIETDILAKHILK